MCVCVCLFSEPPLWSVRPPPPQTPLIYQGELQGDGGKVEDSLRFQAYLQPLDPPSLLPEPPVASMQGSSRETGGRGKKPTESCSPAFNLSLRIYIKKEKKNQRDLRPDLETYTEVRRSVHVRFVYLLNKSVHRKWGLPPKVNPVNSVLDLQYVRFSNLSKQGLSKPMGARITAILVSHAARCLGRSGWCQKTGWAEASCLDVHRSVWQQCNHMQLIYVLFWIYSETYCPFKGTRFSSQRSPWKTVAPSAADEMLLFTICVCTWVRHSHWRVRICGCVIQIHSVPGCGASVCRLTFLVSGRKQNHHMNADMPTIKMLSFPFLEFFSPRFFFSFLSCEMS